MAASSTECFDTQKRRCNVYVASLPLDFDDMQLFDLFAKYGRISSARIMRSKGARQSRGYGFVLFKDADSAEKAIESLVGCTIGGSRIQVRLAHAAASAAYSGQRRSRSDNSTPSLVSEKVVPLSPVPAASPPTPPVLYTQPNDPGILVQTYPVGPMYPAMFPSVVPQIIPQPQTPVPAAMQQVVFFPPYSQQAGSSRTQALYMVVPEPLQGLPPTLA